VDIEGAYSGPTNPSSDRIRVCTAFWPLAVMLQNVFGFVVKE